MGHRANRRSRGMTLLEITITIAIIALLAGILLPNLVRSSAQSRLSSCKTNLRNVATAIEMYALDSGAQPPATLARILPDYLSAIPRCPATDHDTYSGGYTWVNLPMAYTISCQGENHSSVGLPPDFPSYVFGMGFQEP